MKRRLVPSTLLLFACAAVAVAAEGESGLQPGDHAGAYNVTDHTGPSQGKTLCYR